LSITGTVNNEEFNVLLDT